MSRTPELIDRLVKYVTIKSKSNKFNNYICIKPFNAFKECKSFCATILFSVEGHITLDIHCDNIQTHYGSIFRKSVFNTKLKFEDADNIIGEIALGISSFKSHLRYESVIKQVVVDALDILDNITFSIADGKFHRNEEKLLGTEFTELMNELWGLQEEIQCCVCNEKTVTETPCGHKLCIPCWATINETKPRCPMCRAKIDYFENEEIEDSESDN